MEQAYRRGAYINDKLCVLFALQFRRRECELIIHCKKTGFMPELHDPEKYKYLAFV
jgi:hypothetical protein